MSRRSSKKCTNRKKEERQLLAEEERLLNALSQIKEQRKYLRLERLYLESLLPLCENIGVMPAEAGPSVLPQPEQMEESATPSPPPAPPVQAQQQPDLEEPTTSGVQNTHSGKRHKKTKNAAARRN